MKWTITTTTKFWYEQEGHTFTRQVAMIGAQYFGGQQTMPIIPHASLWAPCSKGKSLEIQG